MFRASAFDFTTLTNPCTSPELFASGTNPRNDSSSKEVRKFRMQITPRCKSPAADAGSGVVASFSDVGSMS